VGVGRLGDKGWSWDELSEEVYAWSGGYDLWSE
jgi:hypothetical protein